MKASIWWPEILRVAIGLGFAAGVVSVAVTASAAEGATGHAAQGPWRALFDPALSQWEAFLGVPHGSDTELVRNLLIEIARAHPGVLSNSRRDPVKVLFRSFGDSVLNFELHFTVRDVEERLDVISDINFAIDKAFRQHSIRD